MTQVSIVELGIVPPGGTEHEGLRDALESARRAEREGFHRIWFAEHHLSRAFASHHPEVLIAAAAMATTRIRLGSGATLMNHYSPFKVAEMFSQLQTLAPGRIDLGMGRATAGPVVDLALQRDRANPVRSDHGQQILETLAWLHDAFPADHPFAGNPLTLGSGGVPEAWLLGSSPESSASLAAGLGIGFAFAQFIRPTLAVTALRRYRQEFRASDLGLERPRAMLSVNVSVGDTTADGVHLANGPKGYYARLARARRDVNAIMVPEPDTALPEMTDAERDEPTGVVDGRWPRFVAGSPDDVRATLEQMIEESGADELIIQDFIVDPEARWHSRALLARALGRAPLAATS